MAAREDYHRVVVDAVKEVGPQLLRTPGDRGVVPAGPDPRGAGGPAVQPLAYTKNFSMIIAAVLAITLDPAMRLCSRT